jgi:hypothetical protein
VERKHLAELVYGIRRYAFWDVLALQVTWVKRKQPKTPESENVGGSGNQSCDLKAKSLATKAHIVNSMCAMATRRTHIVIPDPLVSEIDRVVGKRGRSRFLIQAAEKELRRLRQIQALEDTAGAWKDREHPELQEGAAKWVKALRREADRRLEKTSKR